ncbi:hypothetical protein QWY74_03190 [Halomonas almeriensis]|uniref:hypothetical protein n=1 Tax=Halomonas almeriensis TaxID=308163 RepID=UPI0025B2B1DF|nr:hypothetical protein [Halomonas almeriensis]MDN3552480.1 hypothetical protein [Halomonas almeriensis]
MDIVLSADEAYIDKAATVMASVVCHASRPSEITFHLLGHDVSKASRARLEAWFDKLPARLRFTETQHQTTEKWQALSLERFGPATMQPYTYPAVDTKAAHYAEWRQKLLEAASKPAMVHYMGLIKTWSVDSRPPLTSLFRKYMYLTLGTPILEAGQLSSFKRLRRSLLQAPKPWRRRRSLWQPPSLILPVTDREARG